MTFKDKLILTTLSILTLGIYLLVILNKKSHGKNELGVETKVTIDIAKLLNFLGGKVNIVGVEYTHTKVKIFITDRQKVEIDNITKLKGVSGVYTTSKFVTIIVGSSAKVLATKLI